MARHRWATSPPQSSWTAARDGVDRDPSEEVPSASRRWAVARGPSLLLLGLALAVAFGLLVLRGGPAPEVTTVDLSAPDASHQDGVTGQDAGGAHPSGAPPQSVAPPAAEKRAGSVSEGGAGAASAGGAASSESDGPAPEGGTAGGGTPRLLVHVAGAVTRPGIVELESGARVFEALDRAGGALPDADLAAINLAAPVQDGLQIRVPRQGETPAPAGSGSAAPDGAGSAPAAGPGPPGPVNINTAEVTELDTLPRIGPVLAERIVQWRTDHGAFTRPEDLDAVPGIGEAMLAALVPLVTV